MKNKEAKEPHIALHREDIEAMKPGRTINSHLNELIAKLSSTEQNKHNLISKA